MTPECWACTNTSTHPSTLHLVRPGGSNPSTLVLQVSWVFAPKTRLSEWMRVYNKGWRSSPSSGHYYFYKCLHRPPLSGRLSLIAIMFEQCTMSEDVLGFLAVLVTHDSVRCAVPCHAMPCRAVPSQMNPSLIPNAAFGLVPPSSFLG
jgi:hypothetical protein